MPTAWSPTTEVQEQHRHWLLHAPEGASAVNPAAESVLGVPACDPRPVAELGAAIAGTMAHDPGGEAQRTAAWAYWLLGKAMLRASQWRLADDAF